MEFKLYGSTKIPKGKAATFAYKEKVATDIHELVEYVNTHAIIPCSVKKGHRLRDNVTEIYNWIRLDVDVKGEAKKIDKALKKVMYIKKPSTSHKKHPYKWHYLIPIKNVSQNYDAYKLQYYKFLSSHGIELSDKSLASVVQNTNPMGAEGIALTVVNEGKVWEAPLLKAPKRKALKEKHSKISKEEIKKALDLLDPNMGYEQWLQVGFSLFDWCPVKGFKLFDKWSKKGDSYDGTTADKWSDFDKNASGDVTVGTLLHMAHGDKKEAADSFGKEKGSVQPMNKKEKKKRDIKKLEVVEDRSEDIKKQEIGLEYDPNHFPSVISQYMEHAATQLSLNFSAAVPYTMMMLSQLIGDKVKIKMNNAWTHTPIIWGLNIAGAGVGKSPLMKKLSSPIWDIQKTMKNKYDRDMEIYKLEIARHIRDLKQGSVTVEDEPKKPKIKMIIMDEFTPEALYDQLEDNPNGITVWKDELKGMFIQNEKSEVLRTKMISAWSGQNITRNTKTQGVNILVNPYVRVGGNVQPEVVKKIITDNKSGFNADGFIVRFQLVAHLKKLGFHWNVENNLFAKDAFTSACKKLNNCKKEKLLIFDEEGEKMVEEFMKQTNRQVDEASSNFEKEFLSKLGSLFGSLMVIIHQLNEKKKEVVISSQTIRNAINIAETATLNAFHLYGIEKRETQEAEDAEVIITAWLKKSGRKYFEKNKGILTASKVRDVLNKKINTLQITKFFEESNKFEVRQQGRGVNITVL